MHAWTPGSLLFAGLAATLVACAGEPVEELVSSDEAPVAAELGPPVAVDEDPWLDDPDCDELPCVGVVPDVPWATRAFAPGRRTRGTNSQMLLPRNMQVGELEGAGMADLIQWSQNRVFVSRINSFGTGLFHLYLPEAVKAIIVGDFKGTGFHQLCVTYGKKLSCYAASQPGASELTHWFTQDWTPFGGDTYLVADLDGDGKDELLVRHFTTKAWGVGSDNQLVARTDLQLLPVEAGSGSRIAAADLDGDGRDDLLLWSPLQETIVYYSRPDGNKTKVVRSPMEPHGSVFPLGDDISIGHLTGTREQVIARNRATGVSQVYEANGVNALAPVPGIQVSPVLAKPGALLLFGRFAGEGQGRNDVILYEPGPHQFQLYSTTDSEIQPPSYDLGPVRKGPSNDQGWIPQVSKPVLVLKCKFADITTETKPEEFYRDLFLSPGGLGDYWRDVSYGAWDIAGTRVVAGWQQMTITNAAWRELPSRSARQLACRNTYSEPVDGLLFSIAFVNGGGDAGSAGGRVLVGPGSKHTFIAHEMGHNGNFGITHSYDDTDRLAETWSNPGEYYDHWDIGSAMNVKTFLHPLGVPAGPELNAAKRYQKSFIPEHRLVHLTADGVYTIDMAALTRPEADGALMVRIGDDDSEYLTIEHRSKDGWDRGFQNASIQVHRVKDGRTILLTNGGAEHFSGTSVSYELGSKLIKLDGINIVSGHQARVRVTISPKP